MILGYKKLFPWNIPTEFDRKIIHGHKLHTIREDSTNRWHAGRKINHCHGVRTKYFDNFYNNYCKGTQKIEITHGQGQVFVSIDDVFFYNSTERTGSIMDLKMLELAKNDGFETNDDFFAWFKEDFKGKNSLDWIALLT